MSRCAKEETQAQRPIVAGPGQGLGRDEPASGALASWNLKPELQAGCMRRVFC